MRFLLLTEAPGVETDYGTCAIVDLTPELIASIAERRQLLRENITRFSNLDEMRYGEYAAAFYDGVPKSMKIPKAVQKQLDDRGIAQLPDSVEGPDPEKDATTPTDYDWMLITQTGVAWCSGLKHLSFYAFTREIPYMLFLPEEAA